MRAFSYLPEHRLKITDLDPAISSRARSVSAMGEVITDPRQLQLLRDTPWTEVEVYGSSPPAPAGPAGPDQGKGWVQAGPANADGYVVGDGSQWTPRELYILKLTGNIDAYLGYPAQGRSIVKVGLSASPDLRRQSCQKAMPLGSFEWKTFRTTRTLGLDLYPSHSIAMKGEDAMKRHLASCAETKWLGGEFYLATERDIEAAWRLGCEAAEMQWGRS